ncbi:bifunctional diaminohydroxyphosphoribosylaminopyrimidine deaminase/5-amino-6-(5-phosphoribosylamino)uracil reductase RibD [Flammeovirga yaeyamensis]|uniref:Riboflavin biosynthesis protein RibD n=1 Tax=Flammeovirga yaeyamensis TaxID=367791 RepID=A0AAX1N9Q9_9BACT|nr:bifunctional diaminohydroxyphosphoribosylaminopyrimidine deaminase/5-amino-6-(5-phosphoribosylamino)uracil reductase RibD [Flammeovirga yaeyamensis]MBB3697786.1 diaminohydroxyphosphoribosylaminopyrimidine deaminase/5-amino-6-(5-phosphoribosylamino)uracil reductase [Flammeovirga yaeyamensis]QWG03191.1 bifunctional diaminohydroxyphosphoribosylaminopyrimidine deaminase/5-amino-6-(5-phosphoribosylamino)uracil reductase RibD [Flammeovirga yaeyamensis]
MEEKYMYRALQLAQLGKGNVSPNPMVGAVIVHNGKIIGEGYHKKYGEPHAEVNAVASVKEEDKHLLSEAEMYVTLEPCSHYGKTPPCADLIVRNKLKKVYVCNLDPNPLVAGRGIKRIEDAGIKVETKILEKEGFEINKRFFKAMTQQLPYVMLKYAQTKDGFVARENFDSKWISNAQSRQLVHKMRAEEDAILVGRNTAQYDNPSLTVRDWTGNHPTRIVIDRYLKLPKDYHLFDQLVPTIVYNVQQNETSDNLSYVLLPEENFFKSLLEDLFKRGLHSVIVEGGGFVLQEFIDQNLWDEAHVFTSSTAEFGKGVAAPQLKNYQKVSSRNILGDNYSIYYQKK